MTKINRREAIVGAAGLAFSAQALVAGTEKKEVKTPRIAICKILNLGSPCLILGICRNVDREEQWSKYQLFTWEEYLDYTIKPQYDLILTPFTHSLCRTQKEADEEQKQWRKFAKTREKYQGDVIHFNSIGKTVEVFNDEHSFSFDRAKQYVLSKEELKFLKEELSKDDWEDFDWETWGK